MTALADGGFVVAWDDYSDFGGDFSGAVTAQIFHADGTTSGSAFLLNTTQPGFQFSPSLAQLTNGQIVATWHDNSQSPDDPSEAVRSQIFNSDGSKAGSEFLVNTTTANSQAIQSSPHSQTAASPSHGG